MISTYRYITVGVLCAVVLSLFVLRLYNLQFIHGDEYLTQAQESSRKVICLTGARGKILDSSGLPLAYNKTTYDVQFVKDPDLKKDTDRAAYTQSILKTIELVEKNGGKTISTFAIRQQSDGSYAFYWGTDVSAEVAARRAELQSQLLDHRSAQAQAQADYASAKVKADADAKAVARHLIPEVRYEQEQIALAQLKNRMQVEQQRVRAFGGSMQAQLDAVQAKLLQQQSNLQLRQRQADALRVRAGIAGVLQEVAVQEGAQVAAGANLARVARTDVLIARLQVPEVQAKDVLMGMAVNVDTHDGVIAGKVERIDPAVRNGSVQVDVTLTGKLPAGARPDLSVDGRIRIAELHDVLSVGRPALAAAGSDLSLFRLDPDGDTATRVPVRIGSASADRVQVLRGLKTGDKVILSDTSQWDKYDRLRLR